MRISADEKDPGFCCRRMPWAVVYLDGRKMTHVITADEEEGLVVYYQSEGGKVIAAGDEWAQTTERGNVVVRIRSDAPEFAKSIAPDRVELL